MWIEVGSRSFSWIDVFKSRVLSEIIICLASNAGARVTYKGNIIFYEYHFLSPFGGLASILSRMSP